MSWKVLWKKEILRNVRSWRWRCIWSGRLRSLIVEKWVHLNIYSTRADWKTVTVVVCLFSCQYRTTLVSWHQQRSLCSGQRRPVDCTVTLTHRLQSTYNGSVFQFTYISLSLFSLSLFGLEAIYSPGRRTDDVTASGLLTQNKMRSVGQWVSAWTDDQSSAATFCTSSYAINVKSTSRLKSPKTFLKSISVSVHFRRSYSRTRRKVNEIIGWSLASSRIIIITFLGPSHYSGRRR